MSVRLRWDNVNFGESEYNIYRDTSTINTAALPTPIATLGQNSIEYLDEENLAADIYYYLIGATVNGTEYFSNEIMVDVIGGHPLSTLYNGGVAGALFDPAWADSLFQDVAMTVPVTADGQTVAAMLDLSGNGNHATQATASKRPTFKDVGGVKWLEFDGTNDCLNFSSGSFSAGYFIVSSARYDDYSLQGILVGRATTGTQKLGAAGTTLDFFFRGTNGGASVSSNTADHTGTQNIFTGYRRTSPSDQIVGRFNKSEVGVQSDTFSAVDFNRIGCSSSSSVEDFFFNGRFYGAVICESETFSDITTAEDYF